MQHCSRIVRMPPSHASVSDWLMKILAILLVINVLLNSVEQNGAAEAAIATAKEYCDKFGPYNTMCRYANRKACERIYYHGTVNDYVMNEILFEHNRARVWIANGNERTQPQASDMNELVWNPELAKMAQTWANQCHFDNDKNRFTFEFPTNVGQSVSVESSANFLNLNYKYTIRTRWYVHGMQKYTPEPTKNLVVLSSATERYTQVVWANTNSVGCGFNRFMKNSIYYNVYVCNYGPGGNIPNKPVYTVGKPASQCEFGTKPSVTNPGLCTPF